MKTEILAERSVDESRVDVGLIICLMLLLGFGLLTLYVSSENYAVRAFDDGLYFIKRQLVTVSVGLVLMTITACVNMSFIRKLLPVFVIGSFVLCCLTFIPGLGVERNGARRWIALPFGGTFQPSETAKIAVILFLANLFDKKYDRFDTPAVSVYPAAFGLFLFVIIVFLQNDFSTAFFIMLMGFVMFFVAGVYLRWFFAFCIFAIPVAVLFIFSEEYRVNRLIAFLRPDFDLHGINYQLAASRRAISAGGFWGSGLGSGLTYVNGIPEVQADFIFAGWAEAMGFFGVVIYFAILTYLGVCVFRIALRCTERFNSLLAIGFGCFLIVQSILNCGVVCGALPSTGIPLPFFSSGGSSVIVSLLAAGFLINVSRADNKYVREFEYER